ncbi:hypothetical protein BCR44DRAFT_337103 [Catenaria anguillulae PL171]|uniref:Uncharacterized protein n=1 Tax=Catenaria anguillulae PL171 TaxID=765915 RepID=A0A1Y2HNW5_9FUNG|nr:hypothetical protein BCR44DRAFT_337103 [Catenaria anguillulae PL171]
MPLVMSITPGNLSRTTSYVVNLFSRLAPMSRMSVNLPSVASICTLRESGTDLPRYIAPYRRAVLDVPSTLRPSEPFLARHFVMSLDTSYRLRHSRTHILRRWTMRSTMRATRTTFCSLPTGRPTPNQLRVRTNSRPNRPGGGHLAIKLVVTRTTTKATTPIDGIPAVVPTGKTSPNRSCSSNPIRTRAFLLSRSGPSTRIGTESWRIRI